MNLLPQSTTKTSHIMFSSSVSVLSFHTNFVSFHSLTSSIFSAPYSTGTCYMCIYIYYSCVIAKRSVVSAANYAQHSSFAKDQILFFFSIEVIPHENEVFCIQPNFFLADYVVLINVFYTICSLIHGFYFGGNIYTGVHTSKFIFTSVKYISPFHQGVSYIALSSGLLTF